MPDKVAMSQSVSLTLPGRIDTMEVALLTNELTDIVSTNRLGHGWAYVKANQQAIFQAACKDGCDLDWLFIFMNAVIAFHECNAI